MSTIDFQERWHLGNDGKPDHHETIITVPYRAVSLANQSEHWRTRAARAKRARSLFAVATSGPLSTLRKSLMHPGAIWLRLERLAPRSLDADNLVACFKHAQDGITDALGLSSDRDPRLRWEYTQGRGAPKQYAIRVTAWRMP